MLVGCRELLDKYGSLHAVFRALLNNQLTSAEERFGSMLLATCDAVLQNECFKDIAWIESLITRDDAAPAENRAPRFIRLKT